MTASYIHPSAVIDPCVTIGEDCTIGPNVVIGNIGFGYEKHDGDPEWHFRPHPFGVRIGDRVHIGAGTVIDRGRYRDTVIGSGTKIDANVFIAHNCLIGERCLIVANSQISGSCEIGDDCWIGPAAMLTDHVKVRDGGRCGLGAVVRHDVPAGVTVVGNPARDLETVKATPSPVEYAQLVNRVAELEKLHAPRSARVGFHELGDSYELDMAELGRARRDHPGSHGDVRCSEWDAAFGDGADYFGGGELEQRQRAATWAR